MTENFNIGSFFSLHSYEAFFVCKVLSVVLCGCFTVSVN